MTQKDKLIIKTKPIPDDKRIGVPDPRVFKNMARQQPYPEIRDDNHPTMDEIQATRNWMGCENSDLSKNVKTKKQLIQTDSGVIPVTFYDPGGDGNRAATLYFHGGGFFGGSTKIVENGCKLLAERSGSLVVSVDYALAPEHKFPSGLMQCWHMVNWVHKHAENLFIDSEKIAVMGDSAGGNMAIGCSMLDKNSIIKFQVLLYPSVLLDVTKSNWSWDQYQIHPEYSDLLHSLINSIGGSIDQVNAIYFNHPDEMGNPLASPLLSDSLSKMPTTMIVAAEFDYLRQQNEQFALRLSEDNVDTVLYLYKGMPHGFIDYIGEFPQTEDCIDEAAVRIKSI